MQDCTHGVRPSEHLPEKTTTSPRRLTSSSAVSVDPRILAGIEMGDEVVEDEAGHGDAKWSSYITEIHRPSIDVLSLPIPAPKHTHTHIYKLYILVGGLIGLVGDDGVEEGAGFYRGILCHSHLDDGLWRLGDSNRGSRP
ncbi:membrane protein insertase YidC [Striga asiatica]|uniref:Membrane protein insertase YidC n=1 Tax=Striga asiatica TaxID=4170 RepID=A0A5A7QA25_STRAF|nr:membrane protein insertase YidC [Striga asiatica]